MTLKTIGFTNSEDNLIKINGGKEILVQRDKKAKSFSFNAAYCASTDELYKSHLKNEIKSLLSGNNVSVFVIGSSTCGKESILGQLETMGLVSKSLIETFETNSNITALVSMLQVTNEEDLLDLLNPHNRPMQVENHNSIGVSVNGLTELACTKSSEIDKLFQEGSKSAEALKTFQGTTVFTANIYGKPKNSKFNGPISTLRFYNLAGLEQFPEKTGLKAVLHALGKGKQIKSTNLSLLVNHGMTASHEVVLIPCVSSNVAMPIANQSSESLEGPLQVAKNNHEHVTDEADISIGTLDTAKSLQGVKQNPRKQVDLENLINMLRVDVNKLREKISQQRPPKDADLNQMESMIAELNAAKKMDLSKAINLSSQSYEERNNSYSHNGLLWIMEGAPSSNHNKLKTLKTQLDQLVMSFKEKKQKHEEKKSKLQAEIDSYSKQVESGNLNEKETKTKVASIHTLKEECKVTNEKVKEAKKLMKDCQEQLKKEKENNMDFSSWSFDMMQRRLDENYQQMKKENKKLIDEELDKMKIEIENEQKDLNIRVKSGELSSPSTEEFVSISNQFFKLEAEKSVISMQLDMLKKENTQLLETVQKLGDKQKKEAEIKQLQNMQTFRAYRQVFEEFKVDLENRWRGLLDESIQDAVYLNARNSELSDENHQLKQEISKLKQG